MSIIITDGLLGSIDRTTTYFVGSDSEKDFNHRLTYKSDDWYFRRTKISYDNNLLGHRCPNVRDINFDNYILFVGCSHTYGVGNKLEDTYPYLLSKKLNMDYYNLSVGGTSTEVCKHNLSVWLEKFKRPKFIVWQWTHPERFLRKDNNSLNIFLSSGPWIDDDDIKKSLYYQSKLNLFFVRDYLSAKYLESLKVNIPIYEIVLKELSFYTAHNPDALIFDEVDTARDTKHFGPLTHSNLSDQLYKKIEETMR